MTEYDRITEFKEGAELMPDDPVVRFGLAAAYLEAGQAENAIQEYEETIRLKADYSAAHRGLGRALERAGRPEEARAAYRKGLEVAARTGDLSRRRKRSRCFSDVWRPSPIEARVAAGVLYPRFGHLLSPHHRGRGDAPELGVGDGQRAVVRRVAP